MTLKAVILAAATAFSLATAAQAADDTVVARINGADITQADLESAAAEVGAEIASIPAEHQRRVLVEYLIETQLMASAGAKDKLDQGEAFEDRLKYYRRKALRDVFFEEKVRDAVTDEEAKKLYDEQVAKIEPKDEVRARHILVKTEDEAHDIRERLARGEDFAELAKEKSQDPGSGAKGGDLGYFTKDRMVKPFADAAFALDAGDLSEPVESQFGWHIIKVEDKRQQKPPPFDQVKDQIIAALVQEKTRNTLQKLRDEGNIEILDPEVKKSIEATDKAAAAQQEQQKLQDKQEPADAETPKEAETPKQ